MTTDRLVRVATFNGEPMARLWEQTLREEGIPCVARVLGAGPGALGQVSSLAYGLYVDAADEDQARYLLGSSADLPVEEAGPSWSLMSWPPLGRVIAFFFLLIFLGSLIVSLYQSVAG
jgi:hypothetical protein